jgi:hypothetical protein
MNISSNHSTNNYEKYKINLKNNTRKNKINNSSTDLLALPENSIFRKSNLVNIINNAIVFSNKALRRLKNGNTEYLAYQDIDPIGVLNIFTHHATGMRYKIYGYPGFEVAEQFRCKGKRVIKGSKDTLDNNVKKCIEEADLGRIVFKAGYIDKPVDKYVVYVVLDMVRIIAVIDNNATFMNSLTIKEQEFVKSITNQDLLEGMDAQQRVFAGVNFKNDTNMSSILPELIYPSKERNYKLKFSESVNVQEIPKIGKKRVRGGSIRNRTRKNRRRYRA